MSNLNRVHIDYVISGIATTNGSPTNPFGSTIPNRVVDRVFGGAYHGKCMESPVCFVAIPRSFKGTSLTDLETLQETLGVTFKDIGYLQQALVHRSYLNEIDDDALESNERLEFLGDSLLGFVVARRLYADFPEFSEGDLTKLRSSLVMTETLARIAGSLSLGDYLYLGKGEDESGGRHRQRNLACALEAVIGAVLCDRGFRKAKEFVLRILKSELGRSPDETLQKDPKSKLQEVVQAQHRLIPVYHTVDVSGPDHRRVFTVEVLAGEEVLGSGSGRSKRIAEQGAAREALRNLKRGDQRV